MPDKKHAVQHPITTRYTAGYLLVLATVLVIFLLSFYCSWFLNRRHEQMLNQLLEINQLFVDVEDANRYIYDYYTFLRADSGRAYETERTDAQTAVADMRQHLKQRYSRPIMDLCYMVETYLDASNRLVAGLDDYVGKGRATQESSELTAAYNETQDILSFISRSFQEVYTSQLEVTEQANTNIRHAVNLLLFLQILAVAVAAIITASYYQRVVRGITRPLECLTEFAVCVTEDPTRLQTHVEINTGDELELFADAFNEMIDTVHSQMERIEQDGKVREQLQQAEIENLRISSALQASQMALLQSRINPHFLYNTLNMIVQTAHMEEAEETAELMEITADMMRYNLGKLTKSVTLADELANIQNYLRIQRCRFGSRIQFELQTDESCTHLDVPCLILQPLVENAIAHGIGPLVDGGRIVVRLYPADDYIWLEVADNGLGIKVDRLAELRASLDETKEEGAHIGLRNVYQRLRLYFGVALRFTIESVPGDTVIRIGLPRDAGTVP